MNDSKLTVRVLRQDHTDKPNYWQTFQIPYEPGLNVISRIFGVLRVLVALR